MSKNLFTLESDLAEVIRLLQLEGDANDRVLLDDDSEQPLAHVDRKSVV